MIDLRPFDSLGRFRNDWLHARYHFSFANYHDPRRMGWGALRVWNDDQIDAKTGFPPHSHADMEIITYVRAGAISHEDNMGNRGRTIAGDVQVMSAGGGVTHAEYNLENEETRIFQIWLLPKVSGGKPFWGAQSFPKGERAGQLVTLASGFEADIAAGALPIRQDGRLLAATLRPGESLSHPLAPGRRAYAVLAKGEGAVNGVSLNSRDGAAISDVATLAFTAATDAELILVDAP
ncbi:MAG: pirin family protein [Caulobacterales bacterium]|jgi:redox-sensitive bicupin YhaK (pirin superfamily)